MSDALNQAQWRGFGFNNLVISDKKTRHGAKN